MRILITGAAGVIGKALHVYLHNNGHHIIAVDLVDSYDVIRLDLRNKTEVVHFIEKHSPRSIIHLAAIKDLVFCEQHKKMTHNTNYAVTETIVNICLKFNIHLIFFSSDYVFGHSEQAWRETDTPCPNTQYGKDKAACEQLIQQKLSHYAIIRTAQLYGFTGDFIDLVRTALNSQQRFQAFSNLVNCPTWIKDMLIMLNKIIQPQHNGIFHCVGLQAMSRYQYACEIAKALALDTAYIQAVELDFKQDIRPSIVHLDGAATYAKLQYYPKTLQHNLRCLSLNQQNRK